MKPFLRAAFCLSVIGWPGAAAHADETLTFQQLLDRMVAARREITSYDVRITQAVQGPIVFGTFMTTDGKIHEETQKFAAAEYRIARDIAAGVDHTWEKRTLLLKSGMQTSTTTLLVRTPHAKMSAHDKQLQVQKPGAKPDLRKARDSELFDPFVLGWGFSGEIVQRESFEVVYERMSRWDEISPVPVTEIADGVYLCRNPDWNMKVDGNRGYWPIEQKKTNGDQVGTAVKIELKKEGEHWVPAKVELTMQDETSLLLFDWKSLNTPLAEDVTDPEAIAKSYNLELKDYRELMK